MTAAVMPAAMTGPVRRVAVPGEPVELALQALVDGVWIHRRSFFYATAAAAEREKARHEELNHFLFASGRYRLVLIDTEGR